MPGQLDYGRWKEHCRSQGRKNMKAWIICCKSEADNNGLIFAMFLRWKKKGLNQFLNFNLGPNITPRLLVLVLTSGPICGKMPFVVFAEPKMRSWVMSEFSWRKLRDIQSFYYSETVAEIIWFYWKIVESRPRNNDGIFNQTMIGYTICIKNAIILPAKRQHVSIVSYI